MKSFQMQTCSLAFFLCSIIFFTPIITIRIGQPSTLPAEIVVSTAPHEGTITTSDPLNINNGASSVSSGYMDLFLGNRKNPVNNELNQAGIIPNIPDPLLANPSNANADNAVGSTLPNSALPSFRLNGLIDNEKQPSLRLNLEQAASNPVKQLSVDNPQPDALEAKNVDIYREIIKINAANTDSGDVSIELIKLKLPDIRAFIIYISGPEIFSKNGVACNAELFFDDRSIGKQTYRDDDKKRMGEPLIFNSIYNKSDKAKEHSIILKLTGKCEILQGEAVIFSKSFYCANK